MHLTKMNGGNAAGIFAGPMIFILLFFAAALCVGFFIPQTIVVGKAGADIRTEQDWLESGAQNQAAVPGKPLEYALNQSAFHQEISTKGAQTDSGLEMYRKLISRNAVVSFYEEITGDRDVTLAILEYADLYDIPLSLAFSLAFNESRYKVQAVNGNKNASVDRGLFQLNSQAFPGFSEEDFFNPYIRLGVFALLPRYRRKRNFGPCDVQCGNAPRAQQRNASDDFKPYFEHYNVQARLGRYVRR